MAESRRGRFGTDLKLPVSLTGEGDNAVVEYQEVEVTLSLANPAIHNIVTDVTSIRPTGVEVAGYRQVEVKDAQRNFTGYIPIPEEQP